MKPTELKPKDVETIFESARVNGGIYDGDRLPEQPRQWPKGWLSERLEKIRKERGDEQD